MKIVTVIPLKKGIWKGNLTYFTAKEILEGSIVTIPLRNKNILGLVINSESVSEVKSDIKDMAFNLKKIVETKENSIWKKEYIDSILEINRYFAINKSSAVLSFLPAIFIEQYDKIAKFSTQDGSTSGGKNIVDQSIKKIKADKLLLQLPLEDRISVYKTLIRENFALKKSVFIVLPSQNDIKTFMEVLSRGIEQFSFAIHGSLSPKKTLTLLEKIISSTHPILILGTAPFLSIPRHDIGAIILEHESSNIYKMITRPHFDLRVFVELYASKINAKLVLSDTLLRFETIGRDEIDNLSPMHPLSFRIDWSGELDIFSKRVETGDKKFKVLTDESIKAIQDVLNKKKNVFVFSLRKGLATMTVCQDCNDIVSCPKCGGPLVLYKSLDGKKRMFICNKCKEERDSDTHCGNCGSWNLTPLGIGTDTVFEILKENLDKKVKIFKLDKESAKSKTGAEKIMKEFQESSGAILIGTEMAFFYMKDKIPLSVVSSFDSLWSIPNFKMSEKIIQLMLSIISNTTDRLIIQTKNENDSAILAVQSGNLLSFVRDELADRKSLGYPPFKRFIKITHVGDKIKTNEIKEMLREIFKEYNPEIFSGFHAQIKGQYVTNALIKIDTKNWSLPELSLGSKIDEALLHKLLSLPPTFEVSVDPEDLL